jgi:SAM-dependent methyltransferase
VESIEAILQFPHNWAAWRRARTTREPHAPSQARRMFGYAPALLPNPYLAAADAGGQTLRAAIDVTGLTVGYPAWNLLYYALLCSLPPKDGSSVVVVETGTNRGFSTIALAQALKDAKVDGVVSTVDIDPDVVELARRNVAAAGLDSWVRFHVGDSIAFLERLVRESPRIHFAFLDGSHEYRHVRREFATVFQAIVAARGLVYFDNTSTGGVAQALRFIRRAYPGNLVEFPNCSWSPPGNAVWQPN